MHPLVQQLAQELVIAVLLVGAVHVMALGLRAELRRWSETGQSVAMAISLMWVMSGGPRVVTLLYQQLLEVRALVHQAGIRALDHTVLSALLPGVLGGVSVLLAAALLIAVLMEWHNPQPTKRLPPKQK